jgi:hypothetical protein
MRKSILFSIFSSVILVVLLSSELVHSTDLLPTTGIQINAPLTISGFDSTRAAAAGNEIKQIGNSIVLVNKKTGLEIASIPNTNSPQNGAIATPYSTVSGNCGSSNISIINLNNQQYAFTTGFNLVGHVAIDYSWHTSFTSSWTYPHSGNYSFSWDAGGLLAARQSWTSGIVTESTHSPSGIVVVARVVNGTVYTADGSVCSSGYPTASTTVW